MEPKVLANDAPAPSGQSRKLSWLPALLLTVAVLAVLLAVGSTLNAQSTTPASPQADPWATEFCRYSGMACAMGDFDGDGDDDIVAFSRTVTTGGNAGDVYVALSNGTSFATPELWRTGFAVNSSEIPQVGDFNGDGKDDIIVFYRSSAGNAYVALSSGYDFGASSTWITGFCESQEICAVGDFNGDGLDDIARFTRNVYITDLTNSEWGKVYVALSDGGQFSELTSSWIKHFCMGPPDDQNGLQWPETCGVGDFNGDGFDDVIAINKDYATVWVALNNGASKFSSSAMWSPSDKAFCYGNEVCGVGDFNGDGRDDVITYLRSTASGKVGYVYVGLSNGARFPKSDINLWSDNFCIGSEVCGSGATMDGISNTSYSQFSRTGDFNGDTHDDVVRFMRSTNTNYPGYVYVKLAYGNGFVDYVAPTQTPTPSQTPTATLTPTATNTPTITPTASNTPTPMPPLIWVPLVFR
jgi:hypothetical protein